MLSASQVYDYRPEAKASVVPGSHRPAKRHAWIGTFEAGQYSADNGPVQGYLEAICRMVDLQKDGDDRILVPEKAENIQRKQWVLQMSDTGGRTVGEEDLHCRCE